MRSRSCSCSFYMFLSFFYPSVFFILSLSGVAGFAGIEVEASEEGSTGCLVGRTRVLIPEVRGSFCSWCLHDPILTFLLPWSSLFSFSLFSLSSLSLSLSLSLSHPTLKDTFHMVGTISYRHSITCCV